MGPTDDAAEGEVRAAEARIFAAIAAGDAAALAEELTGDFVLVSPGRSDQDRDAFLRTVGSMPYRIVEIGGEELRFRRLGDLAVLSGVQRATVELGEGRTAVGRTAFVDLFARDGGCWRLRHAFGVELPESADG